MTIKKRGSAYHYRFQYKNEKYCGSLRTEDLDTAIALHDEIVKSVKQAQGNSPTVYENFAGSHVFDSNTEWPDIIESFSSGKKSPIDLMYSSMKCRASKKGIECKLTKNDLIQIWLKSNGHCQVSNIPFSDLKPEKSRIYPFRPSIDRIESSGGYTNDNVRLVCNSVNIAMMDFGKEILIYIALKTLSCVGIEEKSRALRSFSTVQKRNHKNHES